MRTSNSNSPVRDSQYVVLRCPHNFKSKAQSEASSLQASVDIDPRSSTYTVCPVSDKIQVDCVAWQRKSNMSDQSIHARGSPSSQLVAKTMSVRIPKLRCKSHTSRLTVYFGWCTTHVYIRYLLVTLTLKPATSTRLWGRARATCPAMPSKVAFRLLPDAPPVFTHLLFLPISPFDEFVQADPLHFPGCILRQNESGLSRNPILLSPFLFPLHPSEPTWVYLSSRGPLEHKTFQIV